MSAAQAHRVRAMLARQLAFARDRHSWRTLQGLVDLLGRAGEQRLHSAVAEALVAQRLMRAGFAVEADVPTPSGRSCDFRAARRGESLCVHVKRLRSDAAAGPEIPRRIRAAIQCGRRVTAELWWAPDLRPAAQARLGRSFNAFLREAAIGESLSVRDAPDFEIGRIRIHRPAARRMELRRERGDRLPALERIERLVLRAFDQCMPRSVNVIVLVGDQESDWELLDQALRGSFVERWDRFPSRGERRAYGRSDDGLWSRQRAPWCRFAVALTLRGAEMEPRLSPGILMVRDGGTDPEPSIRLVRRGLLRSR